MATPNIPSYFKRYGWSYETLDAQTWRATFSGEHDEEYDVYVMVGEEYVHFAVSPFVPEILDECRPRLYEALLRINQGARLVCFALDDDGDVNLLTELPLHRFAYHHFELALNGLVEVALYLAAELRRLATEPRFRGSRLSLKL